MTRYAVDAYVIDTLMFDLVGHDRQPSAFLVYLFFYCRSAGGRVPVPMSHQGISNDTGLSKSAVQSAIRTLTRRRLVRASRESITAVPVYTVMKPWLR